ncbi:hypothetical protein SAMN05216207_1005225 [Pseudonocardia ammonioxydans]|uniref:DUF1648 domain-containing protein n=1 Tax=Pseudonocardia ammonioxydans TaxID=260086 RepID=A0A1I4V8C7_PSUAM|nr:hypothetical protein [Pseudonocardia ammonioxydans]SFM97260.1 hypothetical protein SAMN05216207_1005225 [Pseudonocardia ammonioxydans]
MRSWFPLFAGALCYAAALLWAAGELPPDGVPLHFDAGGTPTSFGTRSRFLGLGALFGVIMAVVGTGTCLLAARGPLGVLNIPHKEYWTRPEHVPRLRRMLAHDMAWTFGVVLAFLSVVPLATVHAVQQQPVRLPVGPVWLTVGVLVVGLVAWCVWLARYRYRPS